MINVLGDALAAGIMAHLCKKDFEKAANTSTTIATPPPNNQRVRRTVAIFDTSEFAVNHIILVCVLYMLLLRRQLKYQPTT